MLQKQKFINESFKFVSLLENSWDFIFAQWWLTVKTYWILYLISTWSNTSRDLLNWTYGSKPNMTKKIKSLESNGFIKRKIDENDKRVFRFTLTKKANEALKKISPIYDSAISLIFYWITEDELKNSLNTIEKCIANFNRFKSKLKI